MIKTSGLAKKFDSVWAVRELNLDIKKGCFYCLLGPNGAGKTTTLRLLAGLLKPTQGKIYILGQDITSSSEVKKFIGFIPDTPFLYENLTIEEFLEFAGAIFQVEKNILRKKIDYYLDIFKLSQLKNILIRECSHGIKQRVVYISNFLHDPQVLLIDEPLVGLDPYSITLIKRLLKEYTHKGSTVLMSTHILNIAEELADIIGIIDKGSLISQGTLSQLREKTSQKSLEEIFLKLTISDYGNY
ncbi:MAG TPA: ABC transporter ATP-binding protein [Candidatus Omnitrophica bacterium]|nr:MAG: ABC transporter ATP-binding protein [Candidatus Omnitrophota bacterium]RKY35292.1 MAG: ABC transporter ATP-binding protein [Candidatus Omnitrophota bacterium]RKY45078.1 MAG: ABC transporter ATP-binding protein [Candidatus Omnitrophota bacterium]HEC69161.1 ABC transporter ATP-binding protein [Candidatus Omnitrophota bacterium]